MGPRSKGLVPLWEGTPELALSWPCEDTVEGETDQKPHQKLTPMTP